MSTNLLLTNKIAKVRDAASMVVVKNYTFHLARTLWLSQVADFDDPSPPVKRSMS
jgi:hypothetical protein